MADKRLEEDQFDEELDTETTFADMNVEGFSWYEPKDKKNQDKPSLSKEEYKSVVKAAFIAYLPLFLIIIGVGVVVFLLALLWLG